MATFLGLIYQTVTPQILPRFHNPIVVLVIESVLFIFWFSGFVAITAEYFSFVRCEHSSDDNNDANSSTSSSRLFSRDHTKAHTASCDSINSHTKAAIWFSLFEFILFLITTVNVVRVFLNYRREGMDLQASGSRSLPGSHFFSLDSIKATFFTKRHRTQNGATMLAEDGEDAFSANDYDSRVDGGAGYNTGGRINNPYATNPFADPYSRQGQSQQYEMNEYRSSGSGAYDEDSDYERVSMPPSHQTNLR